MSTIHELAQAWQDAKELERTAVEQRRMLEDQMAAMMGATEMLDGTLSVNSGNLKIKVVGRISYKVNAGMLEDIVREHDLQDQASQLFRFKPELNVKVWKDIEEGERSYFYDAITTQGGRPSFSIAALENNDE